MTTPTPTPASDCVNQPATCNATSKDLWIVRHGQATHNPRAEAAKAAGCSHETFMQLMQQDDSLDSPLTALGVEQGQAAYKRYQSLWKNSCTFFDLVVASPLSRALHTADLVLPPPPPAPVLPLAAGQNEKINRVCHESFREIHGWLRNAQRQPRRVLQDKFPNWDFSLLQSEEDEWWTETLETHQACAQRGVDGLTWILQRPEEYRILLVAHGGLLRFTMAEFGHKVVMVDGRTDATARERNVQERFANCEVRRYRLSWDDPTLQHEGKLVLTEVDVC